MTDKLRSFVASSSEQLAIADEIARMINRDRAIHAQPWTEKVFQFSKTYIESLERELDQADFAIVVLTGDDTGDVRGQAVNLPRDNVIFELGLFAGRLGRDRAFFFIDDASKTKIASDLSGVMAVTYRRDVPAAGGGPGLKTQVKAVVEQMKALGPRPKPSPAIRNEQAKLWQFTRTFAGYWWERIRQGQDDKSALSYCHVTIDEVTNTPKIDGKAFGLRGEALANWETASSGVVLSGRHRVHYRWEGERQDAHGQTYGGHGVIDLDEMDSNRGEGWFFDTNFGRVSEGAITSVKHFRLYRCTPEEISVMRDTGSDAAHSLIMSKLAALRG